MGSTEHQSGEQLSDSGPHLESVTRAAAGKPHVVCCGMAVENEVPIRALRVLADPGRHHWRPGQRRKAPGQKLTSAVQSLGSRQALFGRGVDQRSPGVVSDLEATALIAGNAVEEALS